jgi:hypothetical protein
LRRLAELKVNTMALMSRRAIAHEVLNSKTFQAELAVVAEKAGKRLPTRARRRTLPSAPW